MQYETTTGIEVHVTPMLAYPDGLLLAAELTAVALPAIGALPAGTIGLVKDVLSSEGGTDSAKLAVMLSAILAPDPSAEGQGAAQASALFDGLTRMLLAMADRARFRRVTGDLLRTLTVRHGGQMLELVSEKEVQQVTGFDLRLLVELLGVAIRGNLASFTSGAGGTSDASATGKPEAPASR